jgi:2'-5' RNA ligase
MKPGIVIISELTGTLATRIHDVQRVYDPRMAAELPPHITLTGSSGMGPIHPETPISALEAALGPIAKTTPPITVSFQRPTQFMQSNVIILLIDPHGPIRELHERIKSTGLPAEPPRFAFTPHCTLNFYRELPREKVRDLLQERFDEPVTIDRIQVYKTETLTRTTKLLELTLEGRGNEGRGKREEGREKPKRHQ